MAVLVILTHICMFHPHPFINRLRLFASYSLHPKNLPWFNFSCRLLMFGNIRRATNAILKTRCSRNIGFKRDVTYPLCQPRVPQHMSGFPRNYSVNYASNTMAHHAQNAWKTISKLHSSHGSTIPAITRAAKAFAIASTRSHPFLPGIFALVFGELALTQKSFAESEYLPSKNAVYMRAQDSQAYMSRLLLDILEVLILLLRAVCLTLLFSPSIAMAPFADSFGPHFRTFWLQLVHRTLEIAGPAFILSLIHI